MFVAQRLRALDFLEVFGGRWFQSGTMLRETLDDPAGGSGALCRPENEISGPADS